MEYKIPQDVRDFIVKYFTETCGLPINYITTTALLRKITPIEGTNKPVEKAKAPQAISPHDIGLTAPVAPAVPVERVIPEKAVIIKSKPRSDNGINNG